MIKVDANQYYNYNNSIYDNTNSKTLALKGGLDVWSNKAVEDRVETVLREAAITGNAPGQGLISGVANMVKDIARIVSNNRITESEQSKRASQSLNLIA